MTRAQKRLFNEMMERGYLTFGTWGDGQKNRPIRKLIELELAIECWVPPNSFLKSYGVRPTKLAMKKFENEKTIPTFRL